MWQEFESIMDKYFEDDEEFPKFEKLLGEEIEKFNEEQIKELKDLYSKILVYEKDKNYRKADLLWEEFGR
ncbi:hypothetical protein [Tepidibacter sp. Z1-5]|uniref:hypothetical protein n=1 Tax=Tepidibacter sp. Z1-5 TaxID=3134138 RepID=UPI0030C4405F